MVYGGGESWVVVGRWAYCRLSRSRFRQGECASQPNAWRLDVWARTELRAGTLCLGTHDMSPGFGANSTISRYNNRAGATLVAENGV